MHGRGYLYGGDKTAAAYIASQLAALGVAPLGATYFQPFTLNVNTFPGRVELASDRRKWQPGGEFIVNAISGKGKGRGKVYRLNDALISGSLEAQQDFLGQRLAGKIVVFNGSSYGKIAEMPAAFMRKLHEGRALVSLEDKLTMNISDRQLSKPWFQLLRQHFDSTSIRISYRLDAQVLENYQSQNVVAYLPGTKSQTGALVFTAHYDHLGRLGKEVYFPGANDNASGVAMLLELAAWYAAHPPDFPVLFIFFGGEEAGLVGSRFYTQNPLFPMRNIRFLINLDLVGTGDDGITVVNGAVYEDEFTRLAALNESMQAMPAVHKRGYAANSDHYFFAEKGVKAFFIYTMGGIKAYHDVDDTAAKLPLTRFPEFFKLLVAFSEKLQPQRR
jgi:hypothetical protein